MTRFRVLPYRQSSRSAKALATALGGKVLKLENSTFQPRTGDVIINWGSTEPNHSSFGAIFEGIVYNCPDTIRQASNKLKFFQLLEDTGLTPQFWTNKESIPDEVYPVVCRTVLSGHSGAGIVVATNPSELVECSLYVKYEKKKEEYRVHVGRRSENIEVIAVQRKARRTDCADPNWQVRNHSNGFVFVRNECNPPEAVTAAAIAALHATGLDFGAVDVIWNEKKERAYVLEINTAPGLEGQTIQDYAEYFKFVAN